MCRPIVFVRDSLAFLQCVVDTATRDLGEVDEDARASFLGQNKSESMLAVEPIDDTSLRVRRGAISRARSRWVACSRADSHQYSRR